MTNAEALQHQAPAGVWKCGVGGVKGCGVGHEAQTPGVRTVANAGVNTGSQWRAMHLTMIAPPMSAWLCVKSVPFRPPTVASWSQACVHTALKRLSSTDHLCRGAGGRAHMH